jgi:hypothetical protein
MAKAIVKSGKGKSKGKGTSSSAGAADPSLVQKLKQIGKQYAKAAKEAKKNPNRGGSYGLPDGNYVVKIVAEGSGIQEHSGYVMLKIKYVVVKGDMAGQGDSITYFLDNPSQLWRVFDGLDRLGVEGADEIDLSDVEAVNETIAQLDGNYYRVSLKTNSVGEKDYQNTYINKAVDMDPSEEEGAGDADDEDADEDTAGEEDDEDAEEAEDEDDSEEESDDDDSEEEDDEDAEEDDDSDADEDAEEEDDSEDEDEAEAEFSVGDKVKFDFDNKNKAVPGKIMKLLPKKNQAHVKPLKTIKGVDKGAVIAVDLGDLEAA